MITDASQTPPPLPAIAEVIARTVNSHSPLQLVITADLAAATQLVDALRFFSPLATEKINHFADWEILPYDHYSPHPGLVSDRLATLATLPTLTSGILVTSITTLMLHTPPLEHLQRHAWQLSIGQTLSPEAIKQKLVAGGYQHNNSLYHHGEWAQRGSLIDLFPMGSKQPIRIEFFDNEIASLRYFDVDSQRTTQKVETIQLLPAHEYDLDKTTVEYFLQQWRERFSGNPRLCPHYQAVSEGLPLAGMENYLPLFFPQLNTLLDFLPPDTPYWLAGPVGPSSETFFKQIEHRYQQYCGDTSRPLCAPRDLYCHPSELFTQLKSLPKQRLPHTDLATRNLPEVQLATHDTQPAQRLSEYLNSTPHKVLICVPTAGRLAILEDWLRNSHITLIHMNDWKAFLDASPSTQALCIAPIAPGIQQTQQGWTLLTEDELFGAAQVRAQKKRSATSRDPNTLIRNLTELRIGSPVVHEQFGVGRYLGLQCLNTGKKINEFIAIEYANKDKIYIPILALDLISRYTGADADHAPLQTLGSQRWQQNKQKAAKKIRDIAAELLKIQAQRQANKGIAFAIDEIDYHRFSQEFSFTETADQARAIETVCADLSATKPMDRLICGDVGFGKTEVAMRAAFVVACQAKQVALLAPTTLLAQQHYQTFTDRFANWPIQIGQLSSMQTPAENKSTLTALAQGKIDIVIGTHKLLSKDTQFHDLGLLIVDEEHRFGVRHKERIKALRAEVELLTLTATPIPRTLNSALSGTRDLSIIATPPERRLSIKTFVVQSNDSIVQEAIQRELLRGGQVYFLHNKVDTLPALQERLLRLIPTLRCEIAHGQMPKNNLERIMRNFCQQKFQLLLCTTIIESGIDIPTANTILIDRADRFGLAQLHQIRGRVGRSHHQAYAYLLVPERNALTRDAQHRLEAISQLDELGAGFQLATHDLEIRGAGELLGGEQSGHMHAIGFTLYMDMLAEAVQALQQGKEPDWERSNKQDMDIEAYVSTLLPEHYLPDVNMRLTLYKRLSHCENPVDLKQFKAELIDRFGPLPEEAEQLLQLCELKLYGHRIGVKCLNITREATLIDFIAHPKVNSRYLIQLIQTESNRYQLQGADRLRIKHQSELFYDQVKQIKECLIALAAKD